MSRPQFIKKFIHTYGIKIRHQVIMFLKWSLISVITGLIVGAFSTLFAFIMNIMTEYRQQNDYMLYFLPLGGIVTVFLYSAFNYKNDKGTNLVLSTIHAKSEIPLRMAPLIFITTIITHVFGGSAGREGAALQLDHRAIAVRAEDLPEPFFILRKEYLRPVGQDQVKVFGLEHVDRRAAETGDGGAVQRQRDVALDLARVDDDAAVVERAAERVAARGGDGHRAAGGGDAAAVDAGAAALEGDVRALGAAVRGAADDVGRRGRRRGRARRGGTDHGLAAAGEYAEAQRQAQKNEGEFFHITACPCRTRVRR